MKLAGFYDTPLEMLADWHETHLDHLKEVLKPTNGRWLGMVEGHHFHEYPDGTTTDTKLADYLHSPFGGTSSTVRLTFRDGRRHATEANIFVTHGTGSGFRNLWKLAPSHPNVHMFIQGHNCELAHDIRSRVLMYGKPGHMKERGQDVHFVLAGGFMRGYAAGTKLGRTGRAQGSYVEKAMMPALPIGGKIFRITPKVKFDYCDVEIEPVS